MHVLADERDEIIIFIIDKTCRSTPEHANGIDKGMLSQTRTAPFTDPIHTLQHVRHGSVMFVYLSMIAMTNLSHSVMT